jgi:RsiW-degrading membrane proteinase PrsW (M82 family)
LNPAKQESSSVSSRKQHKPSIFQLLVSLSAIGILLLLAGLFFISGWLDLLVQSAPIGQSSPRFMSGFALLFTATLLLPSLFFSANRLFNFDIEFKWLSKIWRFVKKRALFLLMITLIFSSVISQFELVALFALPPIHSIASSLIVLFLLLWATRNISMGSSQRSWGVLAASIIIGPLVAIFLEIIVGAILLVLLVFYISSQAKYSGLIESLSRLDRFALNQDLLLEQFSPLMADPVIVLFLLMFISLAVPLIEELIKPIGLYLSMKRKWSPASGFALGALSGAGFALFENLALAVGPADWFTIIGARIGTTSIHLLASGLIGWALVKARNEKKYILLFGIYLLSVALHGFWNATALMLSMSALPNKIGLLSMPIFINGMILALLVMAAGSVFLIRTINRKVLASR